MNQLYGDLDLNGEIEKGGWSKTKSDEQPKNKSNSTNTQFVPTKIAITNINNASNTFNNSTKTNFTPNKVSLAFKPRQASSSSSNAFGKAATTTSIAINNKVSNISSSTTIEASPSYITNNFPPTEPDLSNNTTAVSYESTTYNTLDSSKENTYDNSIPETKTIDIQFDETDVTYECKDAYDPFKPNDYLVYCEERLNAKKQVYTYM